MIIDSNRIPAELASSTLKALCHLYLVGRARPTDIAREAGFTTAAATSMIDRAEAAGLLARGSFPGDRRATSLELTPRGRDLVESLRPVTP